MKSPVVSVIIPCYNAEENLVQCIDSIRNQTLTDIEILCIDDGSADATLSILQDYQKRDSRIVVIQQKNSGAGAARNIGLDHATGEYLSFLDADDFFEPDMLEKAVAAAEAHCADYIVFRSDRYYPAEGRYEAIPWSVRNSDLPPYMPFSYRQLTDNIFLSFVGWAWDKLFRRSFVLAHQLRFQEQRTTNDMLFVFSALICAKRIAVIQDILAHQRRGAGDTLSVTREKSWHCFYDALIALRERLIREDIYWELEKDFINYSLHFCLWHLNSLAEPTHTLLKQKLCEEWFAELGIADKPESYFWNLSEYVQFLRLVKRQRKTSQNEASEEPSPREITSNWQCFEIFSEEKSGEICNRQDAYKMNIRFDHLRDQLMQSREIWEGNQYLYWKNKYHCYQNVYTRLEDCLKEEYCGRMSQEFKRAMQLGQLRKADFTSEEWRNIHTLCTQSQGILSRISHLWVVRKMLPYLPSRIEHTAVTLLNTIVKRKNSTADHNN